jgi:MinD superfamily P-loop ATPase
VASESGIPFGVVINRADVGDRKLTTYCGQNDIPILMEIPFERRIAESYSKGYLIAESIPEYRDRFIELYSTIQGDR